VYELLICSLFNFHNTHFFLSLVKEPMRVLFVMNCLLDTC